MKQRIVGWTAAAALLPLLGACVLGYAEVIEQDMNGGVLALKGAESHAMEDAQKKMAAHCGPGNFRIVKRESVVIGQRTDSSSRRNVQAAQHGHHAAATETGSASTVTQEVRETRIHYVCGQGAAVAQPAPAAQPAVTAQPAPAAQPAVTAQPAPPATSGGVHVQGSATVQIN